MNFDFLKKALPFIASALPGGGIVSTIAKAAIGKALGSIPKTPEDAAKLIAGASPEQMIELQKAEQEFKLQMAQLNITSIEDLEKIASSDRSDARQREIKTGDSWTPRLISATFIIGWFSIQWFLLGHIIPQEMREIIMRTLGTLDMGLGLILGYYFGSSAGSSKKDDTISKLSEGA